MSNSNPYEALTPAISNLRERCEAALAAGFPRVVAYIHIPTWPGQVENLAVTEDRLSQTNTVSPDEWAANPGRIGERLIGPPVMKLEQRDRVLLRLAGTALSELTALVEREPLSAALWKGAEVDLAAGDFRADTRFTRRDELDQRLTGGHLQITTLSQGGGAAEERQGGRELLTMLSVGRHGADFSKSLLCLTRGDEILDLSVVTFDGVNRDDVHFITDKFGDGSLAATLMLSVNEAPADPAWLEFELNEVYQEGLRAGLAEFEVEQAMELIRRYALTAPSRHTEPSPEIITSFTEFADALAQGPTLQN